MRRWGALCLFVAAAGTACSSSSEAPPFAAPLTGADFVIYGTASAGHQVIPSAVRVARATDVTALRPDPVGGGDVDMFFAGLKHEDLPDGLEPTALQVVARSEDHARRLPKLYAPNVLVAPGPPDGRLGLAPVEGASLPASVAAERSERLRKLIENLAILDPCAEPLSPIAINTPRTPAEEIRALRTLSSGDTFVGFTVSSTVVLGTVVPADLDVAVFAVDTGGPLGPSDRTRIIDLGDREARGPSGRVVPRDLPVSFLGNFGGTGQVLTYDEARGRYVDDSPATRDEHDQPILPENVSGVRHVTLDGAPSICAYGSVRGPRFVAGIWCRTETSTTWRAEAAVPDGHLFIGVIDRPAPKSPLAVDLTGVVYARTDGRWTPIARSAANDGCSPPCVSFDHLYQPPSGDVLAVITGTGGLVLLLRELGDDRVELAEVDAISPNLFADERPDADAPIHFSSLTESPDGALWLGSQANVLVRVSPDRSRARRVCLPKDASSAAVTALEAKSTGELYLGMTPALFGFGRWQE